MRGRIIRIVVFTAVLVVALAYLREPAWLDSVESGFRSWETGADGRRYRWTTGHASFFVPASAASIEIPMRTTFGPGDPAVLVSISIDDRPADRFIVRDDQWLMRKIRMPQPGSRRLRRIDIKIDRLRPGNRGIQMGDVVVAFH
jgi:hypothetical protein